MGEREGEMRAVVGRKWILWEAREEKERTFVLNLTLPALALSSPSFHSYFLSSFPLHPPHHAPRYFFLFVIFFFYAFLPSLPLLHYISSSLSSLLFRASFRRLSPGRPAPRSHLPAPPLGAIPSPFNAGGGASPPPLQSAKVCRHAPSRAPCTVTFVADVTLDTRRPPPPRRVTLAAVLCDAVLARRR